MPFIKRYDTLASEILTEEEIVNIKPEKENKPEIKEDNKNKGELMKANEIAEIIIFN
jgi:hypothetical protein